MSREIDFEQRLSKKDVEYLYQRNRWREVLDNYKRFGGDYEVQIPKGAPVTGPESLVNAAGLDALTPEQQREYEEGLKSEEDEDVDYNKMTVDELKAELDTRRQEAATDDERENLSYKSGDKKPDLIRRLDRDDELVAARGE